MNRKHLTFKSSIAKQKPTNQDTCPFCYQEALGKVLDRQDEMVWVENKYPVLEDAYQTLIIESHQHDSDMPDYTRDYNRKLFAYVFEKWQSLRASGDYKSVLCYKNFGSLSGGSLRHPHLQIVGLDELDGYDQVSAVDFEGEIIVQDKAIITLSTEPVAGGLEFNVIISDFSASDALADAVQLILSYLVHLYFPKFKTEPSYNLFFYPWETGVVCKIMPRHIVSPYLLGYGIRQVPSDKRLDSVVKEVRNYLSKEQKKRG